MHGKYRALIWEQARLAGVLSAWCLAVALLFLFSLWLGMRGVEYSLEDAQEAATYAVLFGGAVVSGLYTFRFDNAGHLVQGFDARLYRLPVETWFLVTTILACRIVGLLVVVLGGILTSNMLLDTGIAPLHALWILTLYLIAQAGSWSGNALPYLKYLAVCVLAAALLLIVRSTYPGRMPVDSYAGLSEFFHGTALWVSGCLALASGAAGGSFASIVWDRHGERRGPRPLRELWEQLADVRRGDATRFKSAFTAQCWIERRRFGWLLPVAVVGGTLLLAIASVMIELALEDDPQPGRVLARWFWTFPITSLLFGAAVSGLRAGATASRGAWNKTSQGYALLRPMTDADLAAAKTTALFDSLLI